MASGLLSPEQLSQRMRDLVFSGHLGPARGKGIAFDTVREDDTSITFVAALVLLTEAAAPLDRFLIRLAKQDGALLSTMPVSLDKDEMANVLQNAGCGELVKYDRLSGGAFGTTYKAKVSKEHDTTEEYIVQLRYHARVDHMYHLIRYIRDKGGDNLPVPQMFPTTPSPESDLGIQVSQFVPGPMGSELFIGLAKEGKLNVITQMARVFSALWDLDAPGANKAIGEVIVSAEDTVSVGPERRYGLGGPFPSVTSYLQAWIKHRVKRLQDQKAIDEYKDKYLQLILDFVESEVDKIPPEVEDVKLTFAHTDLGLHNMIFSEP